MKILMPVLHYKPAIGGFEIFIENIAERIGEKDDIFIVTGKIKNTPEEERINHLRVYRSSSLVALKDFSRSKFIYILTAMVFIFFKSLRLIKKEKIDMIHAQGFLSGILAYLLKKITKKPYLITIQSADFNIYHPRLNIKFIIKIYQKIEKIIFNNADYCHAVSSYLGSHFNRYGIKKIAVIPNGVNQSEFKPDSCKRETRQKLGFNTENLIICVSRLEHKNGTHDLIEAANYLNKEINDFKIIICGDGSDRQKLEKMVEKFNLKDRVLFLGDILHAELPKYVACADIFVRPSLAEGFGIVFLEAMAAGLAVIATPVGGIPDFLKDRENGLFCQPGNPKDIADKIEALIKDKTLTQKLIQNGFKIIKEEYNWDKISERIKKLYAEIINS
jgi:glycosyltransferase involved in cell wall biosynthesis